MKLKLVTVQKVQYINANDEYNPRKYRMSGIIKNLSELDLSEWNFDIDVDIPKIIETGVRSFFSEAEITLWTPDGRASVMDARISICAHPDVCNKINPYTDVNLSKFIKDEIDWRKHDINQGFNDDDDKLLKKELCTLKADLLSLAALIEDQINE